MKLTHMAKYVSNDGRMSALCFKNPRAINLKVASWTLEQERVNCWKCEVLLDLGKWLSDRDEINKQDN